MSIFFLQSLLMLCWSVLQISLFVVLSCHLVLRMYLSHLLMNVCSIRVVVLVTLQVSEPYSSTLFTLVLKILILFHVEKDDVFHTVFKILNACLARTLESRKLEPYQWRHIVDRTTLTQHLYMALCIFVIQPSVATVVVTLQLSQTYLTYHDGA